MNQKLNHSPIHGHAYGQNDYTGVMITNNMGFSQNRSLAANANLWSGSSLDNYVEASKSFVSLSIF